VRLAQPRKPVTFRVRCVTNVCETFRFIRRALATVCEFLQVIEAKLSKNFTVADDASLAAGIALGVDFPSYCLGNSAKRPRVAFAAADPTQSSDTDGPDASSDDEADSDGDDIAPAAVSSSGADGDDGSEEPIPIQVAIDSTKSNAMAGHCFCLTGCTRIARPCCFPADFSFILFSFVVLFQVR
jgi:hypothetical protein